MIKSKERKTNDDWLKVIAKKKFEQVGEFRDIIFVNFYFSKIASKF